jgi:hypothetical protein
VIRRSSEVRRATIEAPFAAVTAAPIILNVWTGSVEASIASNMLGFKVILGLAAPLKEFQFD